MKNIILVSLFVSALNFNVYASNPILEDLKNTQYSYLDYVLEKIRGSLDKWIRTWSIYGSSEDTFGYKAFSLDDVDLVYDDENIVFYIVLRQQKMPEKKWHNKTYEEYKTTVLNNLAHNAFSHFGAFGKDGISHNMWQLFIHPKNSLYEFNLLNKTNPKRQILKDGKFIFIPDEVEEFIKNYEGPKRVFTENDLHEFAKRMKRKIYLGIRVHFHKSPTSFFDFMSSADKWEKCYSKYRLDAEYQYSNGIRLHPIPIRSKCFKGRY